MYWPALYCSVSLAGSWSWMTITSCDFFSSEITRDGMRLMGKASADVTWRDSSTMSLCGLAQQVKI